MSTSANGQGQTRNRWRVLGWSACVTLTVLSGFVVGYSPEWSRLFGTFATPSDYAIAAGGYAATGLVLAIGVPALLTRAPRWLAFVAAAVAVVYLAAAVQEARTGSSLDAEQLDVTWFWRGVNGVLWWPWTWPLLIFGPFDAVRWLVHRTRTGQARRAHQDVDHGP